jgi:hypothetical protein
MRGKVGRDERQPVLQRQVFFQFPNKFIGESVRKSAGDKMYFHGLPS